MHLNAGVHGYAYPIICLLVPMALQRFVGPWSLFQCLDLVTQSVGLLGRGISPSQGRLPAPKAAQTENKRTQKSMHQMEHDPGVRASEDSSCLRRAATVLG
jgi:hypothetical protein